MDQTAIHSANYHAVERDDPRFDGQFFTAVLTTGIFCRSVCTAQTPRAENVRFFSTAAAAAESGFRPCLRCRPESAPDPPPWQSVSPVISQALRLIGQGFLDTHGTDDLARRLNVSGRHLQRLFLDELGTPPIAVAQTRRLLFAKKLIDETNLPMTEVAFSAGYRSVRRFNESIRQTYGQTPTEIRRKRRRANVDPDSSTIDLRLYYREPYNWPAMRAFISEHGIPRVEQIDGTVYRRAIAVGETRGLIEGETIDGVNAVLLRVPESMARHLFGIAERVKQMFDFSADPIAVDTHLQRDPALRSAVDEHPGLRIPGTWDAYALIIRTLLEHALGRETGRIATRQLVERFGERLTEIKDDPAFRCFPRPERLAGVDRNELDLPADVADAIRAMSRMTINSRLSFDGSRRRDDLSQLLETIFGSGDGIVEYVLMRALGLPDEDLGDCRLLIDGNTSISARATGAEPATWRPWRSYAAMYQWASARMSAPASAEA